MKVHLQQRHSHMFGLNMGTAIRRPNARGFRRPVHPGAAVVVAAGRDRYVLSGRLVRSHEGAADGDDGNQNVHGEKSFRHSAAAMDPASILTNVIAALMISNGMTVSAGSHPCTRSK
ncbi:hypothetical protein [Nocardia aurantiaca]|nr:hypothetical protein [Nocardia aurantiaca]